MNTINKLQFKHHSETILGSTLEEARENVMQYIKDKWFETDAANKENSPYRSLFAEPMVFRYAVEGDEENPHVMLLIGADNNTGNQVTYNKYCIVDIDKTEQEIEDLWEEIEKIIKRLAFTVFDSKTIDLSVEQTELGTFLSGDVKTASTHTFSLDGNTIVKENNLLIGDGGASGPEGLFLYVDLIYDEENNKYVFLVNKADGTLKKVVLPNNYLVSGEYDVKDESIHLKMKDGEEVIVNCENLIAEWTVEGDASKTPIVLTREEVDYDSTDEHHHVEPWQDVLKADVRIASGRTNNILNKTIDGRYLYVDGEAKNIIYYWNGERTTVEQQLNELKKIKISQDDDNILWNREDGFFATVNLDYLSISNTLRFSKTNVSGGTQYKDIPLNTVSIIESITYDPIREVLIIKYKNDKGETETVEVPISGMIDEWDVLNNGHSVKLTKQRNVSGKDILTADVNISNTLENNILEERGEGDLHALYVKGTADNIKEDIDGNVQVAINNLRAKDDEINGRLDEQQAEIEAVSADSANSLKDIINNDHSINVDKSDAVKPIIKVNLSEQDGDNSIRLKSDGLYNFVDLTYDSETNKLKLIKSTFSADTTVEKEIKLDTISVIESITYDPHTEELIIVYYSGTERKETRVPLRDLIDEWEVYNDPDSAVKLHREPVIDGKDKLSGLVVITSAHTDNILENSHGALYVPANTDVTRALSASIDTEKSEREAADRTLEDAIQDESVRAKLAENALSSFTITAINEEKTRAMTAEGALDTAIIDERRRAEQADALLQDAINDEVARSETKDNEHDSKIAALEVSANTLDRAIESENRRAMSAETALGTKIDNEATRAINAESELNTNLTSKIVVTESRLQAAIDSEKSRAEAADQVLSGTIVTEKERAMTAESELRNAITAEAAARETKDGELSSKIDAATLTFDDTASIDFNIPSEEGNVVKANVKLQESDNIIKLGSGLYATVRLNYSAGTNTLQLVTSNGEQEVIQLAGVTFIDRCYYDSINKNIVIVYKDGQGQEHTTTIGVSDLLNEWDVNNDGTPIKLTKTIATSGGIDTLKANVKLSEHDDNLLTIDGDALYVSGEAVSSAGTAVQCALNEIGAIEKNILGLTVSGECGNGEYEKLARTHYISDADSFMDADAILDENLFWFLYPINKITCRTSRS